MTSPELPLVSIIIPVKDRYEWFVECLDSILDQQYRPIEIIIIDDGSQAPIKLGTINLGNVRSINHVKILRNDVSKGPGACREIGRLNSHGEYLLYLDSDDLIHSDYLAIQVQALITNPFAGMCYCTSVEFVDLPLTGKEPTWSISNQGYSSILPVILFQRPWATGSCLWKKEITDQIGPWSNLWVGEDIDYEVRAGCLGIEIVHTHQTLCFVRRNDSGVHLSILGIKHAIDATYYLLSSAEHILRSSYAENQIIRNRIIQILLNKAIFLFDQDMVGMAEKCLSMLNSFQKAGSLKHRLIRYYWLLSKFLPHHLTVRLGRKVVRPYILSQAKISEFSLAIFANKAQ